ncbi:MAG: hypothetical protein DRO09_01210 [Thermoprotei archaeon]|nr:MAG: hypothetical protein DRO09_01210 [Thermoprotei archaeon]
MTSVILDGGKKLPWVLRIFGFNLRKRPDRSKVLASLIVKIESSISEIRDSVTKLKLRYDNLLKRAITALLRGERDKALIYANEMVEVKSMFKKLKVSEKALEQVKLRLETIESVTNVPMVLNEIAGILAATKDYVHDVMPALAYGLDSLITETRRVMSETTDVEERSVEVIHYTPEAKKLLKEIEAAAEESVSKQLPELPLSLITPYRRGVEVRIKESQTSYMRKPPKGILKKQVKDIDRKVMEYIIMHGGFIDIADAALQLGVPKDEVVESLHRLKEQNKIVF